MSSGHIEDSIVDKAVAEGGAYEVIRKRLEEQGNALSNKVQAINEARLSEFGKSDLAIATRTRIRTENNCIARDIVQVGPLLLFGYNVFIGLKKETRVNDVFSLFSLKQTDNNFELEHVDEQDSFLTNTQFQKDFHELYRYYKETRLMELTVKDGKLLMGFQISDRVEDIRVFRWAISPDGSQVDYIDNRGERDIQMPPAFDFEWIETTRDDTVHGRHSHVNILDTLFVETINGDLTIKVENNTEDGLGIYNEEVEDKTQSIDDAEFKYAALGELILLSVLPYKEDTTRYFIYNRLTDEVKRIDTIGTSCIQLPEDHGVIFPGGYYLQNGEHKRFDLSHEGYQFRRSIKSPNGEDVLYVFYEVAHGNVALLAYNLIEKSLQNPILCHGYALGENGNVVLFSAEDEPTRVHPMQIWHTPFVSDEFASLQKGGEGFYGRIGNADLVRGISDSLSVCRAISNQGVSVRIYEELSRSALKIFDDHYWFTEPETKEAAVLLREISANAELAIDEFQKVESIRQQSESSLKKAVEEQKDILHSIRDNSNESVESFVSGLDTLRHQRGHLATLKEYRYIDLERIAQLDKELVTAQEDQSQRTVVFLSQDDALTPYSEKLKRINQEIENVKTIAELKPILESLESMASGLDLLSELLASLHVDDATVRTRIIDTITHVYSKLNQSRAQAKHTQKNLGSEEATAQFSAQFKLFSQSITNALGQADTPENCDKHMSRLLIQLEELESQFSEFDQFLADIMSKREEVYESFESHKQRLIDAQQRKAQSISDAADRVLNSIQRRVNKFTDVDELNTYFASDALVLKVREFSEQLRTLSANVQADDIDSRFKSIKEQGLRLLRDKSDIYEGGGNVIKLGPRHRFSVNTQELDLTLLPRNNALNVHLSGTEYYEEIEDDALRQLRNYWSVNLESESDAIYRSEYLAGLIYEAATKNEHNLSLDVLHHALTDDDILHKLVREFAAPRYKEGYEKGIHDHDAALILKHFIPAVDRAGLLTYDPHSRGFAQVFWANIEGISSKLKSMRLSYDTWTERAQSAAQLNNIFKSREASQLLSDEIEMAMNEFLSENPITCSSLTVKRSAAYLAEELSREHCAFVCSKYASQLAEELKRSVNDDSWRRFQTALERMFGWPAERWALSESWLNAMVAEKDLSHLSRYIPEAIALINADERISRNFTEADVEINIPGCLGDHTLIKDRSLHFAIDEYLTRFTTHKDEFIPRYHSFLQLRQSTIENEKSRLRLHEFKPRPLSSFVRNRLINESYLPIIGDNLAKQMGTVGEDKRSDLMGLLMMISPPGYGKTTLMEYVADRLGLIFMKINCPSLGHDVLSLDPEQAPNATARQELYKLNLALEMGNNVMLYLDDIQHTHPEFLQKFISLCDGTRRIDGIWKGKTKTYDMRGKKFCVVMAGNPYTESGEVFKIPDMLANRADIYNLGDILGGMDEQFALSYIENSLTSNRVLSPLATREMKDVYLLVDLALGKDVATTDLSHQYSAAEIREITEVLKKLFVIRDVILLINKQYIQSAAQDDQYRTEPPFKLQGSYRNMNKMAEKVSSVMNDQELIQLIDDHYQGESQLLTKGAEENILKLGELRGTLSETDQQRWADIKQNYVRTQQMGGGDADTGTKLVAQLIDLRSTMSELKDIAKTSFETQKNIQIKQLKLEKQRLTLSASEQSTSAEDEQHTLAVLDKMQEAIRGSLEKVEVINQPVPGIDKLLGVLATTIEQSIFPLVRSMDKKLDIDLRTHDKMSEVSTQLRALENELKSGKLDSPSASGK